MGVFLIVFPGCIKHPQPPVLFACCLKHINHARLIRMKAFMSDCSEAFAGFTLFDDIKRYNYGIFNSDERVKRERSALFRFPAYLV